MLGTYITVLLACWLVTLGGYSLGLVYASANEGCARKDGDSPTYNTLEVSWAPPGFACRRVDPDDGTRYDQYPHHGPEWVDGPGPVTVMLQILLVAAPGIAWLAAGRSQAVARRRHVAEAYVVAGIGLLALAATAIAIGSGGLGAILGVLGASLLIFGAMYRRRTRPAAPVPAGPGGGV